MIDKGDRLLPINYCDECKFIGHYGIIFRTHYCTKTGLIVEPNRVNYVNSHKHQIPDGCILEKDIRKF
jgi:hypothetical protein